jgi:hypothetical protein
MLTKEHVASLRLLAAYCPPHAQDTARDIASAIEYELSDRAKRDSEYQALQDIGKSAAESIAEMVAALECDYDRLGELREHAAGMHAELPLDTDEAEELAELEKAAGECSDREDAEQRIYEDPLSVEFRSGWYPYADKECPHPPEEFLILLSTGGPATRIIGELNEHCEPTRARLQAQDWFKPWTDYTGDAVSDDDLLTYCRCFYFGE